MKTNVILFNHKDFGDIRIIEKDSDIWFLGVDIAKILGYQDPSATVVKRVSKEYKLRCQISNAGQMREMTFINEPGIYQLIFSSKMPDAEKFRKWVFEDVLPSIRKTGMYIDSNHEDIRKLVKTVRNYETSAIADLIRYGRKQGYKINDITVYSDLTFKTQTEFCGIPIKGRDEVSSGNLIDLIGVEVTVIYTIYKMINKNKDYRKIYKAIINNVKNFLMEDLYFIYDKETDTFHVEVKQKKHNLIIQVGDMKIKIPNSFME